MKTHEFIDKLSTMPLETDKNRVYVERGIQLIEWEKPELSAEEKNKLEQLKTSIANSGKSGTPLKS
jgi:hypothetical protein